MLKCCSSHGLLLASRLLDKVVHFCHDSAKADPAKHAGRVHRAALSPAMASSLLHMACQGFRGPGECVQAILMCLKWESDQRQEIAKDVLVAASAGQISLAGVSFLQEPEALLEMDSIKGEGAEDDEREKPLRKAKVCRKHMFNMTQVWLLNMRPRFGNPHKTQE